jgi:hypothetical protein
VVARVLDSLASLSEIRLFDKARMLELFSNCYGFLVHPSAWVRQGLCIEVATPIPHRLTILSLYAAAASFIASVAKQLTNTDVSCLLYPYLKPLLRADLAVVSQITLLDSITSPVRSSYVLNGPLSIDRIAYLASYRVSSLKAGRIGLVAVFEVRSGVKPMCRVEKVSRPRLFTCDILRRVRR